MECNLTCIEGADGNSELTGGYCPTYSENGKFPQSINLCLDHAIDSSKFGTNDQTDSISKKGPGHSLVQPGLLLGAPMGLQD